MPILIGETPPPPIPPEEEPQPEQVFTDYPSMFWTGWTGDSWQLAGNFKSLTMLTRDGRTGMILPEIEHIHDESATSDGAYWRGYKSRIREIGWPVFIWGESPTEMRAEHDRFLRTLQPDKTGTFTVASPDGLRKSLQLRYAGGAEGSQDGGLYGISWQRYPALKLIAADPYWSGDLISQGFGNTAAANFYGGGTPGVSMGPPYHIASSQTLASAALANPGDRPAYVKWRIDGPFTSITLIGGGSTITLPITKTVGQWIEVDTDPTVATIVDHTGANMWPSAGAVTFAAMPPNATTSLSIVVVGATTATKVTVSFTPKYWRAW